MHNELSATCQVVKSVGKTSVEPRGAAVSTDPHGSGQPWQLGAGNDIYQECFCSAMVLGLRQGSGPLLLLLKKKNRNLLLLGIKPLAMWKKSLNTEKLFIFVRKHSLVLRMIKKQ